MPHDNHYPKPGRFDVLDSKGNPDKGSRNETGNRDCRIDGKRVFLGTKESYLELTDDMRNVT